MWPSCHQHNCAPPIPQSPLSDDARRVALHYHHPSCSRRFGLPYDTATPLSSHTFTDAVSGATLFTITLPMGVLLLSIVPITFRTPKVVTSRASGLLTCAHIVGANLYKVATSEELTRLVFLKTGAARVPPISGEVQPALLEALKKNHMTFFSALADCAAVYPHLTFAPFFLPSQKSTGEYYDEDINDGDYRDDSHNNNDGGVLDSDSDYEGGGVYDNRRDGGGGGGVAASPSKKKSAAVGRAAAGTSTGPDTGSV
ncbi:hypothetical protein Pelo_19065 [Pelomyxa schiedti]|nr:hypothetical protein Pelo_19065 [Pelomyxa schiedti]